MSPGRTAGALLAAALLACAGAAPARADDSGFRYWSFWEGEGQGDGWSYATQGPGTLRTGDGDVLGLRFAVSAEASDVHRPRVEPDFDLICPPTEVAVDGSRVALVIDYGTAAHAPDGERPPRPATRTACAEVPDGATAGEALAEVAESLRYNADGLLCAIDGYPEQGCGEQVSASGDAPPEADDAAAPEAEAEAEDDGSGGGSAVAVATGVAAVAVLAVAAVLRSRRRRG